jgi:hypothetical protein
MTAGSCARHKAGKVKQASMTQVSNFCFTGATSEGDAEIALTSQEGL